MSAPVPHGERVITDPIELFEALVDKFLDGTAEERQHIVDTLGDRPEAGTAGHS